MAKKIKEKSAVPKKAVKPYEQKQKKSALNEAAGAYGNSDADTMLDELPSEAFVLTNIHEIPQEEKNKLIKTGVTKRFLLNLKKAMGLDYRSLTRILAIPKEEIINKRMDETFSKSESERIVSLAEINSYGVEVFGVKEYFQRWFVRPNRAMGSVAPITLANTSAGLLEIKRSLGRIEHGIF